MPFIIFFDQKVPFSATNGSAQVNVMISMCTLKKAKLHAGKIYCFNYIGNALVYYFYFSVQIRALQAKSATCSISADVPLFFRHTRFQHESVALHIAVFRPAVHSYCKVYRFKHSPESVFVPHTLHVTTAAVIPMLQSWLLFPEAPIYLRITSSGLLYQFGKGKKLTVFPEQNEHNQSNILTEKQT